MTNTQHTPGPWEVSEYRPPYDDMGGDYSIGYTDADGVFWEIATLEPWRGSRHADARLIAAAPELLEALELIDSHLTRCINFSGVNPELRERLEQQQHNARAAIAKAKGQ